MNFVENKEIVLPGTLISDNKIELGTGTYRDNGKIYSNIKGLVYFGTDIVSIIPLKYSYEPKYGDLVIGKVVNSSYSSWTIDLNSIYQGFIPMNELYDEYEQSISNIINVKDMLLLRIVNIDEINRIKLTLRNHGLGKFNQGMIIRVKQPTVHFLSEENAFITTMLQESKHTDMIIGKNGLIWLNGSKEDVEEIIKIIEFIEENILEKNIVKKVQSLIINH